MNEPRTTPTTQLTATTRRLRAQRSDDALVARYVLELSGRHGGSAPGAAGAGPESRERRPGTRTTEHGPAAFRVRDRGRTLVCA